MKFTVCKHWLGFPGLSCSSKVFVATALDKEHAIAPFQESSPWCAWELEGAQTQTREEVARACRLAEKSSAVGLHQGSSAGVASQSACLSPCETTTLSARAQLGPGHCSCPAGPQWDLSAFAGPLTSKRRTSPKIVALHLRSSQWLARGNEGRRGLAEKSSAVGLHQGSSAGVASQSACLSPCETTTLSTRAQLGPGHCSCPAGPQWDLSAFAGPLTSKRRTSPKIVAMASPRHSPG